MRQASTFSAALETAPDSDVLATVIGTSPAGAKVQLPSGEILPRVHLVGGAAVGDQVRLRYVNGVYVAQGGIGGASGSGSGTSIGVGGGGSSSGAPSPHDLLGIHHTLPTLSAGVFFAGPTGGSGSPAFRGIVATDLPLAAIAGAGLVVAFNTLAVGTPSTISPTSSNVSGAGTHAHYLDRTPAYGWDGLHTFNAGVAVPAGQVAAFGGDVAVTRVAADTFGSTTDYAQFARLGAGVQPGYPVHARSGSGAQMRLDVDGASYTDFIVNSLGNLTIAPSGPLATLPPAVRLQSTNYASQTTGWGIDGPTGGGDFRYLFADEMHVRLFIADLEQALAGGQIIGKSVAVLASAFTAPAVPTSFLTIQRRGQTTATGQGGPQTITLVNSSSTSFVGSSGSVNIPSGTADNDFMLLGVYFWNGETLTTPSGWIQVRTLSESSTGMTLRIFRRVASSEGASVGLTFSGSLEASAAIITTRGVDTTNPIIADSGSDNGTGTSMSAPSVDVGAVTGAFLAFFGGAERQNATPSATANGNLVERVDQSHTTGQFRELIYVATEAYAGTGNTGTRSATLVASLTNQAAMIALRPGNGGNTSVSASPPGSTAENDYMLAGVVYSGGTLTPPANWLLIESRSNFAVYAKRATASETAGNWALNSSNGMSVHIIGYYNVDLASPIAANVSQSNASSTSMSSGTITNPLTEGVLVFIGSTASGTPTSTAPGGMTERTDAGGNGTMVTIADEVITGSGSGARVATLSSAFANAAALFALRPAPNGGQTPIVLRDLPSAPNMAVFESGDIIRVPEYSRSAGSLTVAACWGSVAGYTDNPDGTQTWTFTRSSAPNGGSMSAGTVIQPDAIILDYGVSGNGYYEVNAVDGAYGANSPYAQFVTWTGHPATGRVVRTRSGHLRGIFGVNNEFGLFAGAGVTDNDSYLRLSNSAARFNNIPIQLFSAGVQKVNFSSSGTDVWIGVSSADRRFNWDGTTLTVSGAINVVSITGLNYAGSASPGGVANAIAGQGSLATQNSADWITQVSGRPGIDGQNRLITNAPPSPTAGLWITANYLGYYDGSQWRTYMDNAGRFYYRGSGGAVVQWTGARLEGLNNASAVQWYADSTSGVLAAGAGTAWVDSTGFAVQFSTGAGSDARAFRFVNSAGATVGRMSGWYDSTNSRGIEIYTTDGNRQSWHYASMDSGTVYALIGANNISLSRNAEIRAETTATRGAIFLNTDSGTGARVEVNSPSLIASGAVYASNWFRSYGASGWYNETYGAGWFAQDSSFVRSYNGRHVYTTGGFLSDTPIATHVLRNSAQSIAHATWTAITFTSAISDPWARWDGGSACYAQYAGYYMVTVRGTWTGNSTGVRQIAILRNSAEYVSTHTDVASSGDHHQSVAFIIYLAAGEYVQMLVYQSSGGALNIGSASSAFYCRMGFAKIA